MTWWGTPPTCTLRPTTRGFRAEAPHPQPVAQHHHRVAPRLVLVRAERPAEHGGQAVHLEVLVAHARAPHALRLAVVREVVGLRVVRRQRLERARLPLHREVVADRHRARAAAERRRHVVEPVRLGERQRPQHDRVQHAVDRRGRPDAQRERGDGHEREHGPRGHLPHGVGRVAPHVGQPPAHLQAPVARVAERLQPCLQRGLVSEPAHGFRARVLLRHSLLHQLARDHVEVKTDLLARLIGHGDAP